MELSQLQPKFIHFLNEALGNGCILLYNDVLETYVIAYNPERYEHPVIPYYWEVRFLDTVELVIDFEGSFFFTDFSTEGNLWKNCTVKVINLVEEHIKEIKG